MYTAGVWWENFVMARYKIFVSYLGCNLQRFSLGNLFLHLKSSHYAVYWVSNCVKGRFEVELFDVPPLVVDWCLREI